MPRVPEGYLEARRQSIVAAAVRVFSSKGVEAATMADVAREAGITPGAIYRYFPGKVELAKCCFDEYAEPILGQWVKEPPKSANPLRDFEALADATFAILNDPIERPHTILTLEATLKVCREGTAEEMAAFNESDTMVAEGIARWIRAAQVAGEMPDELDPELMARAMMSFYWGARMAKLMDPSLDTDGQLAQIRMLINAQSRQKRPTG